MKVIVAVDQKWGIGKKNGLLFSLKKDMDFFRETTLGKVVVMGSNTLLSFPSSKPLKNRTNIVLWPGGKAIEGCCVVQSMQELAEELRRYKTDDVFVIGGAMMYHTMLPYCKEAYVTKVDSDGGAEVFFDDLDEKPEWTLKKESEVTRDNGFDIKFTVYENGDVKPFCL